MRGQLTNKVQDIAEKVLGRPLSGMVELRLLPYLDYLMKNEQKIDPRKINEEERHILSELKEQGHIAGGAVGLQMTKEFYDAIQEILWQAYVVQGADEYNTMDMEVLKAAAENE
jgi:hypothetical protein